MSKILEQLQAEGTGLTGLLDAALLVRRAGLEHLVTDPTPQEVLVLAKAGELIAYERAELVARAITSPLEFRSAVDGGDALVDAVLDAALTKAVARRSGRAA